MRSIALVLIALAGCGVAAQLGATAPTPAASAAASSAPSAAPGPGAEPGGIAGRRMLPVPDVIGKTPDEARAMVKAAGFATDAEQDTAIGCTAEPGDPALVEGRVDCQTPEAGKLASSSAIVQFSVYAPHHFSGEKLAKVLHTCVGLTVDDARRKIKQGGFANPVMVSVYDKFHSECQQDRVCYISQSEGDPAHPISLFINPRLEIAAPPP